MHSLSIIKRLNQQKQDEFEGKEVTEVKPDIQKKTISRQLFFKKLYQKQDALDNYLEKWDVPQK